MDRRDQTINNLLRHLQNMLTLVDHGLCACQPTGDGFYKCKIHSAADYLKQVARGDMTPSERLMKVAGQQKSSFTSLGDAADRVVLAVGEKIKDR